MRIDCIRYSMQKSMLADNRICSMLHTPFVVFNMRLQLTGSDHLNR